MGLKSLFHNAIIVTLTESNGYIISQLTVIIDMANPSVVEKTQTGQQEAAELAAKAIKEWDGQSTTFHVVVSKRHEGFAIKSFSSGPEPLLEELVVVDVVSGPV